MLPNTSAPQFNDYLWYLLYLKMGNLVLNVILLLVHRRFKAMYQIQKSSLSMRYAMEEISKSSKFTLIITFTHLLFFGTYTVCSILVRVLGIPFFGSFLNHYVARGVNCAIPTYNLVIVFVVFTSLRHLNTKRSLEVQSTVQIVATGYEGAKNYEYATMNRWATIAKDDQRLVLGWHTRQRQNEAPMTNSSSASSPIVTTTSETLQKFEYLARNV
ncbi:hypothetical protein B9Z55_006443 [Caenorhabditis nigoni]|nr:hypothetical protein B9Z55_006443 [Caenorhabditis nigoni]